MKTKEAIQALLNGRKIRRKTWCSDFYVYLKDDMIYNQSGDADDEVVFGPGYEWELFKEKPKVSYKNGRVHMEISPEEATKIFLLIGNMSNPVNTNGLFNEIDEMLFNDDNPGPEFVINTPNNFEEEVNTIVNKYFTT